MHKKLAKCTRRCYYTPTRLAKLSEDNKCWQGGREAGALPGCWFNVNQDKCLQIPLVSKFVSWCLVYRNSFTCAPGIKIFSRALFVTATSWKQLKYPLSGKQLNIQSYTHWMESATVLKMTSYSHTHQPSWVLEWRAEQMIQVTVQWV